MNIWNKLKTWLDQPHALNDEEQGLINRATRVPLSTLHHIHLMVAERELPLVNISTGGLAIMDTRGDAQAWQLCHNLNAMITIYQHQMKIELAVRHINQRMIGLQVVSANLPQYAELVEHYLQQEIRASEMREVHPGSVRQSVHGTTRWWNGGDECDLWIVTQGNVIEQFKFYFLGNIVIGGEHSPIRMGQLFPQDRHKEHWTIHDLKPMTESDMDSILKCLQCLIGLEPKWKTQLITIIQKNYNLAYLSGSQRKKQIKAAS